MKSFRWIMFVALFGAATGAARAAEEITIYSGRAQSLVQPLIDKFTATSGIKANVRYGDTAAMASTILEEGKNSPADLFYAQDAGALGALREAGVLAALPASLTGKVSAKFCSPDSSWIGISGRVRVVVYNTKLLKEADLPDSILDYTDPKWKGKVGWAPTNGSFQAFVTAMRLKLGEEATTKWLKGILANEPKNFPNNVSIVDSVGAGEIQVGFVNHYYLLKFLKEKGQDFPARNFHPRKGDIGAMVNVSGVGILKTSKKSPAATKFIEFLLSPEAQTYFAMNTEEYPLVPGTPIDPALTPIDKIEAPDLDLSKLGDLKGTLKLLQDTGVLQ